MLTSGSSHLDQVRRHSLMEVNNNKGIPLTEKQAESCLLVNGTYVFQYYLILIKCM